MKLALLNTTIGTINKGLIRFTPLTLEGAQQIFHEVNDGNCSIHRDGVQSFVGHQSTAQLFSTLMRSEVKMERGIFAQEIGQSALCLKLKGRAPEGVILTLEEIETIGYEFILMTRLD